MIYIFHSQNSYLPFSLQILRNFKQIKNVEIANVTAPTATTGMITFDLFFPSKLYIRISITNLLCNTNLLYKFRQRININNKCKNKPGGGTDGKFVGGIGGD